MSSKNLSTTVKSEITSNFFEPMLKFLNRNYVLKNSKNFVNMNLALGGVNELSFTVLDSQRQPSFTVKLVAKQAIKIEVVPVAENYDVQLVEEIKQDLIINIQFFEEEIRKTTLYFAWLEGQDVKPETEMRTKRSILGKVFSSGMYLFFIISITVSIFLFLLFGFYAVIIITVLQFALFLFSDQIIARVGDWQITSKNPVVHLFQYHLLVEDYVKLKDQFSAKQLAEIKSEIYKKTLGAGKPLDCKIVSEVFSKYNINCDPKNMLTKKINLYEIVKKVAKKFNAPIPRIILANTMVPNAAATGPSPNRAVTLITTGLLVQLEEDEIVNVVGHEFSHLKNRDPLILLTLTSAEYLLRIYLFINLFASIFWFGYFYLFASLSLLYFVAKFFEGRADLDAAIKIGQPKVLANALEKIGFRRLQFKNVSQYRIQSWIRWDPHPPMYFRVKRLENLENLEDIKHPFIQSVKDNLRAFWSSLQN